MSKVVRVQDFLIRKDPDKYKKMFEKKAKNEEKEKAKQEAVETLPNENRELLKEIQLLGEEIKLLMGEKEELRRMNKNLADNHKKQEGYIKDLKKIIDEKGDSPPDDQSEGGEENKDEKKKSKRELERERK